MQSEVPLSSLRQLTAPDTRGTRNDENEVCIIMQYDAKVRGLEINEIELTLNTYTLHALRI